MWKWVVGVILLWFLITMGVLALSCGQTSEASDWGDAFGAANALFSGLAFVVVLFTLKSQETQLRIQQEESKKQYQALSKQQFEATFFQMLNLHNQIVSALDIDQKRNSARSYETIRGRECFVNFVREIPGFKDSAKSKRPDSNDDDILLDAYMGFYNSRRGDLGHYFRNLYNVIKMVDRSDQSNEDKQVYANIVRAQISDYELSILFLNCLGEHGIEKFKPLVENYSLLKHVSFGGIVAQGLVMRYKQKAFGDEKNYREKMLVFKK